MGQLEPRRSAPGADLLTRVVVRHESPANWEQVERVVRDAFDQATEAQLVARLRSVNGTLSLVGTVDEVVAGHVMFSPVPPHGKATAVAAFGLAPVSVAPGWQRRGIGSRLITEGLEQLRAAGTGLVVVLGDPTYYSRFGFVAAAPAGLTCKWGGEEGAFQMIELIEGSARLYQGLVEYDPVFDEFAW
jgi:putative acetyltransferase